MNDNTEKTTEGNSAKIIKHPTDILLKPKNIKLKRIESKIFKKSKSNKN